MNIVTHEFNKIQLIATIGEFKVDYTLTNHSGNSYGLFIESIDWFVGMCPQHEWSMDFRNYVGEVEVEDGHGQLDFTNVNDMLRKTVYEEMNSFVNELACMVKDVR